MLENEKIINNPIPLPQSENEESVQLQDLSLGVGEEDQAEKSHEILVSNPLLNNDELEKIKITSDNFVDKVPAKTNHEISRVHILLHRLPEDQRPKVSDVVYKIIPGTFLGEVYTLHKEFSPLMYDKGFFKKYFSQKTYFTYGAFITLENVEYLIGYTLFEICSEKRFKQNASNALRNPSCLQKVKNCFTKTTSDKFAYLCSMGVIDEYRRMKISTELVNKMIEILKQNDVIAIYTHVIEHNISAIRFFENLDWLYGGVVFAFYNFGNNYYNGQVYYYIISNKEEFSQAEIRGYNEPPVDNTCFLVKAWRVVKKTVTT